MAASFQQMFSSAAANVLLNTQISTISWDGNRFTMTSPNSSNTYYSDIVVIAAPIEKTGIQFNNVTFRSQITPRNFVNCFVTHVQAVGTNPVYFGLSADEWSPDDVLTTPESTLPFTILSVGSLLFHFLLLCFLLFFLFLCSEAPSQTVPGSKVYKLFSNSDITQDLNQIFLNVTDYHVQVCFCVFTRFC